MIDVVVGVSRGDEGKGRVIDSLAEKYQIVARYNGGPNAGHTVVLPDGRDLALHLVPSGIAHPDIMNVIGNGVFVNPPMLDEEICGIEAKGIEVSEDNLMISSAANLILPQYIYEDWIREAGKDSQGTTKRGIAQSAAQKAMRMGVRMELIQDNPNLLHSIVLEGLLAQRALRETVEGLEPIIEEREADLFMEKAMRLSKYVCNTTEYLNGQLRSPISALVLAEGAQGALLDVDHGMHPLTTSSSTTSGGVSPGLGVPPTYIRNVFAVAKAIQSHVGDGPFVTQIPDGDLLDRLYGDMNQIDSEVGVTSKRKRKLGYFDLTQIKRALMVNGEPGKQEMCLNKLDWLNRFGKQILVCTGYRYRGHELSIAPDAAYKLEECEAVLEELPGWDEDISGVRYFEDLPKNAQKYVEFIEDQTEVPITMIGVGPRRDEVIVRPKS